MRRLFVLVLAGIAVGIGAAWAAFAHDLGAAEVRLRTGSETIDTTFGRMEYASLGRGEPVLAIHGAAGGFDQALDMTGALAGRGYRVIAPSRFGYLRSARPRGASTGMQADAYAQLLDHLGVEKVTVVAISAGAWSALQFAARHPDRCRALVLLVPADYLPEGASIRGGPLVEAIFKSDIVAWGAVRSTAIAPGPLSEMMLGTDAAVVRHATPGEQARVRQVLEHLLPIGPRRDGMQFDVETAARRTPYPIDKIACPVLAISAEDDRFGTAARAREIAAAAPDGRALVFPTGGHALVGRYADALQAITAFLEGTPRQAGPIAPKRGPRG
jgi:pimeloyl-ACP methyl ester carboxylesterase